MTTATAMKTLSLLAFWMSFPFAMAALPPVEIQSYKFFESGTGEEVVVKGIDYYPRPNAGDLNVNSMDLFTEKHRATWERDIPFLQELGVNAVRLYAVTASENHDAFMCAMEAAGIYVIVALAHDCPTCAVTRDQAPDCYPPELKLQGQTVIHAFSKYANTLAFSAGNEVNHFAPADQPAWNAPCQKKFIRDMRAYIDSCPALRKVPVGLVSADSERDKLAKYYNCQTDPDDEYETAEWYGLNSYVFCDGNATTYDDAPGFQLLGDSFASYNYSIPVLLTEFGCLSNSFPTEDDYKGQRDFLQAKWMLEEPYMRDLFSGGFVFEYSNEKANANDYGVGHFENQDCDEITNPCFYVPHPSFYHLKNAYESAVVTNTVTKDSFVPALGRRKPSQCPDGYPALSDLAWIADTTKDLKCPEAEQASNFVCPSDYKELFVKDHWNGSAVVGMVGFLLGAACAAVGVMIALHKNRDSIPQLLTNLPQLLTIRKYSEEDSLSDESNSLLSMKNCQGGGKYQALSANSSFEDIVQP